ncbi:hypothetical protein [Paraburkholderia terricola]|uniref:hypothetical protein n=1 Tax=Paraburkholderia terricola TaxID=169427 RepID=UPI000DEEF27F|nr:hypothetical protein [Paraburkholderia terricola]AXE93980.1 hypothetical protein CUJ90_17825 [Paraburkholderia terricola]
MTQIARATWAWIAAALYCFVLNANAAELPAGLQKSLKPFAIVSATIDDGVLKINIRKPVVKREDVYQFVVKMGVCYPLWIDAQKGWGSASITSIEVRNDIGAQGYSFQGGRKECGELGKSANMDAEKKYIEAHTWVCVAGNPCRPRRPGEVTSGDL